MPVLIKLALGWGLPSWAAKVFAWAMPVLAIVAIVVVGVALIYHKGETAGGATVQVQAEKAHAKTVAEAKADGESAQKVTDAIGARVIAIDDKTTTLVRSKMTEIHNELDSTPGTAPGAPAPAVAFDTGGVRASLNAVVADANRSADAADAER